MTSLLLCLLAATRVEVTSTGCAFAVEEVRRIADIELSRGPDSAHVIVSLTCSDQTLLVRVDDQVTRKILERSTPLEALPQTTRARFAAIAIAELVEASWSELLLPAAAAPVPPELRKDVVRALPSRRIVLLASGGARGFITRSLLQGGGGGRAEVELLGPLHLTAELGFFHGTTSISHGKATADSIEGVLFLTLAHDWQVVRVDGGLGVRAGGARLVGTPDDPSAFVGSTVSSALFGPAVGAGLSLHFGAFVARLGVEAGAAVVRLEGSVDGQPATGLTGAWAAATLGLGVRL